LGLSPQAGSNWVGSNTIDPAENDFGLLAAIGPALRQFSVASRLGFAGNSRAATFSRLRPKLRANK